MSKIPKCNCGNDCANSNSPKQYSFKIPFTKIEVHIWDWSKNDYLNQCMECIMDNDRRPYEDIAHEAYKEGLHDGYVNAMQQ